jgi:hypothetical protein
MNKKIVDILLKEVFNENHPGIQRIKKYFREEVITSQTLNMLAEIIDNPSWEEMYPGDYFKVSFDELSKNIDEVEYDNLIDLGLIDDGYVYGKIVMSDSYSRSVHKPYYWKMKTRIYFCHDSEFVELDYDLDTYKLIKVDKSKIKFLKNG